MNCNAEDAFSEEKPILTPVLAILKAVYFVRLVDGLAQSVLPLVELPQDIANRRRYKLAFQGRRAAVQSE